MDRYGSVRGNGLWCSLGHNSVYVKVLRHSQLNAIKEVRIFFNLCLLGQFLRLFGHDHFGQVLVLGCKYRWRVVGFIFTLWNHFCLPVQAFNDNQRLQFIGNIGKHVIGIAVFVNSHFHFAFLVGVFSDLILQILVQLLAFLLMLCLIDAVISLHYWLGAYKLGYPG